MRDAGPGLADSTPRTPRRPWPLGSRRRGRSSRLKRQRRRRARPKHTHPPHPRPARLRRVRPRETTSAGRWARAPPRPLARRGEALWAQLATSRGTEALGTARGRRPATTTGGFGWQWAPPTSAGLCGAGSSRLSGRQRQGQCRPGGGVPRGDNAAARSSRLSVAGPPRRSVLPPAPVWGGENDSSKRPRLEPFPFSPNPGAASRPPGRRPAR